MQLARIFLTVILLGCSALSFLLDWSANHLLNPEWSGHARFHGGLLLFMLAGVSLTATWLLWRRSKEPEVAITAASLLALSFWTPLFYVGFLVPGSTPWAGPAANIPHIAGRVFYPNMAVGAVFVILILGVWRMARRVSS
jgi:hypothetical protein